MGTAGATLLALLFVAVSLGAGYLTEERQPATRTFMSPIVVHFASVFFLSAVALFPSHQARFFAAFIAATAMIGAAISAYITIQVVRTDLTNYVEDYFAYGLLPGVAYLALLAAAVIDLSGKGFWAERAGMRAVTVDVGQYPQRLGSDARHGPPAPRRGLSAHSRSADLAGPPRILRAKIAARV